MDHDALEELAVAMAVADEYVRALPSFSQCLREGQRLRIPQGIGNRLS